MGSTRREMVDVVLVDDDEPTAHTGGTSATGTSASEPLDPPPPPRDRRLVWRRRARRWWPVAAGLALVLGTTGVVADRRETRRMAALADVPGILAPLGNTLSERWRIDDLQYWLVGTTTELLIGTLDRPDGSGAVVGLEAATGDVAWEVAARQASAANYGTQCAAPISRPTTDPAGAAAVVACVLVDEIESVTVAAIGEASFPSKARLLVLDATDGTVLVDEPTDPSTMVFAAGADLVIGQVRPDGRYQVSRQNGWDAPARWTFTTPDPLGVDEVGHRSAWAHATGDLVQVDSWSMSSDGGARASWVLDADGSALRSPAGTGSDAFGAGYGGGYGVLRRGRLLTEPDIATGSSYTMLTDLATGSSFRVDASPFDALPDDGSLDDLVLAQSSSGVDLIAYSLAAGRPLWTVPGPSTTRAMIIEGRIVRAETDRLVSIDGRTGETIWSTPIDGSQMSADSYQATTTSVFTDGRVVLVVGLDHTQVPEVTAYGLNDGRKLWSSPLPRGVWLHEFDGKLYGQSDQGFLALG